MKKIIRILVLVALAAFCFFTNKTEADTFDEFRYKEVEGGIEIIGGPDEGDIVIPDTIDSKPVVSIGDTAFYVARITGVTIPKSVTTLERGSFKYCKELKYVKIIGSGIKTIGEESFEGCESLSSINLPTSITTIEERAFVNCSSLPDIDLSQLSINEIGKCVFGNCDKMTKLKLPDSLTKIPEMFCDGCSNLTTVVLGDKTTSIGEDAFSFDKKLKTINFPNTLTSIGDYAFYTTDSLKTITLPDSLKKIAKNAFNDSGLKIVYCSYNSYAFNYFKTTSVKVITGDPNIDNAHTVYTKSGKKYLNHKKIYLTCGFFDKLILYNAKGKVKWKSSNKKVATVSKKGVIKAKKPGKATIIGKNDGKKFKCKVKVYANKVNLPTNCSMDSGIGVSIYATSIEKYYNDYIVTYVVNNSSGHRLRNLDAVDCILLDSGNRFYQSKKVSFRYVPRTFKVKYKGLRKIDLRHASLNISSASYFRVYYYIN
ncbi:leucine-rich repeat protein [Eubacterium sp.]|uniref:leucine-rich repeat protein n=1 Tax=Eubacterium sp. TaxID=142586 RepID=UPI0025D7F1B6|nr:leucine-rich repeat protein [Eubacterium sp.]MCR5629234.1 leucine-rich repeat protein [Eubacterium sp.]